MFQPQTGNPTDLGSISNFYVAILFVPDPPFYACHLMSARGGIPSHAPSLSPLLNVRSPHRIICPPRRHLSLSHHNEVRSSLYLTLLHPCLPLPLYACSIPYAAPLLPPKYLLTLHSAASDPPFAATMAYGASPLRRILSTYCKPQLLVLTSPTPPLASAACQFTPPVSVFPLP